MCAGDDRNCPDFELHRQKLLDDLDAERRSFLKSAFVATGGAAALTAGGMSLVAPAAAQTVAPRQGQPKHHYVPATADTVHWGYFSKLLKPVVEIDPGDYVTIETLTHHANDDAERMVKGDPGAESVYLWTKDKKGVNRRGAGPIDGKLLGRGAGEGFGVHICTGPVYVRGAEPGDILEVADHGREAAARAPTRPMPARSFGSNAAAWWGFHYKELITEPKPREVITIYEIDATGQRNWAKAVYNFQWTPQTDPFGVVHKTIDYPGVPVDHSARSRRTTASSRTCAFRSGRISASWAWRRRKPTSSTPSRPAISAATSTIGGSARARPCTIRSRCPERLFSVGDPHAVAGRLRIVRHGDRMLADRHLPAHPAQEGHARRTSLASLNYPLLETQDEWVMHGFSFANYLQELGPEGAVGRSTRSHRSISR